LDLIAFIPTCQHCSHIESSFLKLHGLCHIYIYIYIHKTTTQAFKINSEAECFHAGFVWEKPHHFNTLLLFSQSLSNEFILPFPKKASEGNMKPAL